MERLTCKNSEDWNVLCDASDFDKKGNVKHTPICKDICKDHGCSDCPIQKAIDKLSDYEDAEEAGLLLRLPCKPGTEVFYIYGKPGKTDCIINKTNFSAFDIDKIGKSLFLTKAEAEAALNKLQAMQKKEEEA